MKVYMTSFASGTIPYEDVSFLYRGTVIREDRTPDTLGMEDGDAILVEKILLALKVIAPDGKEDVLFMKTMSTMKGLMSDWCSKRQYEMEHVRFLFDGERVGEDQTPHDLGMEDFDTLEVSFHHDYKHLAAVSGRRSGGGYIAAQGGRRLWRGRGAGWRQGGGGLTEFRSRRPIHAASCEIAYRRH